MEKKDVKSFGDLVRYAQKRAGQSLRRNDPVAQAYWKESEAWANSCTDETFADRAELIDLCKRWVAAASDALEGRRFMESALRYSRAKWLVIIARNRGIVMNPKETGVNLSWLKDKAAV